MGSIISGIAGGVGATNKYQASNPYDSRQLQLDLSNQAQIYGQQQSLAQALQQQMAGQGPNPAQTQYLGNVQNNIANTQGLIASQRGLNPALAARMGANQATAANNQAGLGAALLQQQQQLNATNSLGGLYGQEQQGNLAQQSLYNQANQANQSLGAGIAQQNASTNAGIAGGLFNAIGAGGASAASKGSGGGSPAPMETVSEVAAHGAIIKGTPKVPGDSTENDTVHAMLSPGEIVIPRSKAHDPEKAKAFIDHLLGENKKSKGEYKDVLAARRKRKAA